MTEAKKKELELILPKLIVELRNPNTEDVMRTLVRIIPNNYDLGEFVRNFIEKIDKKEK